MNKKIDEIMKITRFQMPQTKEEHCHRNTNSGLNDCLSRQFSPRFKHCQIAKKQHQSHLILLQKARV